VPHLCRSAGGAVQQQHAIMHHLILQPQRCAFLQQAGHQAGAVLQVAQAHVLQHQVVAGLKALHRTKRLAALLLRERLAGVGGLFSSAAREERGHLRAEGVAAHPGCQLRALRLQHAKVGAVLHSPARSKRQEWQMWRGPAPAAAADTPALSRAQHSCWCGFNCNAV
jgi:hypothetical protein